MLGELISNAFFIVFFLLMVLVFLIAVIVFLVAFWRAMRAHESIATSLKMIALNMRMEDFE